MGVICHTQYSHTQRGVVYHRRKQRHENERTRENRAFDEIVLEGDAVCPCQPVRVGDRSHRPSLHARSNDGSAIGVSIVSIVDTRCQRCELEKVAHVRVPHVVVVGGIDGLGDADGDGVPAQVLWIVGVEVVGGVGTVTAAVLDDIFVVVADDDREIAVGLDPLLADGFDRLLAPVAVHGDDAVDGVGRQRSGVVEHRDPLLDRVHTSPCETTMKTGSVTVWGQTATVFARAVWAVDMGGITDRSRERVAAALDRLETEYDAVPVVDKQWQWSPDHYEFIVDRFERGTVGGAGIWPVADDGAVLLVRKDGDDGWAEPSGKQEPDESLEATARRETREETGIAATITGVALAQRVAIRAAGEPPVHRLIVVFDGRAERVEPAPQPGEIAAARWWDHHPETLLYADLADLSIPAAE